MAEPTDRFDERMVAIARVDDPARSLEGIFLRGAGQNAADGADGRGAVIAAPHPLYGGSMESPVVSEIAYACSRVGIASLRFNWRGVGASSGEPSGDTGDADRDYDAAIAHQAETVDGPLIACGYSFGAASTVRAVERTPRIRAMVLVAPPPALMEPCVIGALPYRALVIAGSADTLAPVRDLEAALGSASNVSLVVVPGADHFFASGLAAVGRAVAEWL